MNFNVSLKQQKDIKTLFFLDAGESKVEVSMDKDGYTPKEVVQLKLNFDNEKCDEAVKHATIRFIREVSSVSASGIELNDKTILFKRKVDGVDKN